MSIPRCLTDHRLCLDAAARLLGESARAVELRWDCEQLLRPHLRFESRSGIDGEEPILAFDTGRPGHELAAGIECYRIAADDSSVLRIARVYTPAGDYQAAAYYDFWAVPETQYRAFYRLLRRLEWQAAQAIAPLMPEADAQRLEANTIGFLRRGCAALRKYGIPQRRGVLLVGPPGNGKTMACRWIRQKCSRHGLACQHVSAESFAQSLAEGEAHTLFHLSRPGIVFFDDFDTALRDRESCGASPERMSFLSGLDGIDIHGSVVYVFTSNVHAEQLDPAIRRPGRLDLIMTFPEPSHELRRQLIMTRWHEDLRRQLPLEQVLRQTDGMSFAELEELKKLLVLQHIESSRCDWRSAWQEYRQGRGDTTARPALGFAPRASLPAEDLVPDTAASHR